MSILTIAIVVVVLLVVIGAFKAMTKEERAIVTKGTFNVTKITGAYAYRTGKEVGKAAYKSGEWVGNEVSLNHQEALTSIDTFNKEVVNDKGAFKVGAKAADRHLDTLGIKDFNKAVSSSIAKQMEELKAAREARA